MKIPAGGRVISFPIDKLYTNALSFAVRPLSYGKATRLKEKTFKNGASLPLVRMKDHGFKPSIPSFTLVQRQVVGISI
jgi:hypothetical protein